MKYAIVLFNLGGPDKLSAVEPFLFNLFYDPAIISLPNPLRWIIAKIIAKKRAPFAQEIYHKIGGKSPLIAETTKQAQALEKALKPHGKFKVFVAMRYWKPSAQDALINIKKYRPDKIILLPLYPQYSTTTTASSFQQWHKIAKQLGLSIKTQEVNHYYEDKDFINAHVNLLKQQYKKALKSGIPKVLFSAHGIPLNRIKRGDPYQTQVTKTVEAIIKELAIADLDYSICYQSKVGPLKWLEPATDAEIIKAAKNKRVIIVVPVSFVSEHVETLVELDIEYRLLAEQNGCTKYLRVPALREHSLYINSLKKLCLQKIEG